MKRIAVSILLHSGRGSREVLLVERSPELKFFGGYMAFPGGVLERQDGLIPVQNVPEDADEDFTGFVASAARELFEETGVWLGRGRRRVEAAVLERYRRSMLAGGMSFSDVLRETGHTIDARDFEPLCRITTPPFVPVRYDTWFLRCSLPEGARVEILPGELVGGGFVQPGEAIEHWRQGELLIAAPVIIMLEEMSRGDGFVGRIRELTASYDRGKLHRVYFTPGVLLAPLETPTQPPATHTNTYIVGHETLLVVDPAPYDPSEQEKLWELLDEMLGEGRRLEGVVLTHAHPDHVGAAVECRRRYRVPVYAHRDAARSNPRVEIDLHLEHEQVIDLGVSPDGAAGWSLRAHYTPGHAPGHLAFQESRYKALLLGDLISTLSSILIDPSDGHLRTYLDSLQSMEALAEGTVYPSHGAPARDGRKAIRSQLRHRRQREEQVLRALTREPQTVKELVSRIYTDVDRSMHGLAERSLISGLCKLEEEGKACRRQGGYCLAG